MFGLLTPNEFYIDMCRGRKYKLNSEIEGIHLDYKLTNYETHFMNSFPSKSGKDILIEDFLSLNALHSGLNNLIFP